MNPAFAIRAAQARDLPDIAGIHHRGWERAYRLLLPAERIAAMRPERRSAFWAAALAEPETLLLVAESEPEGARAAESAPSLLQGFLFGGPVLAHEVRRGSPAGCAREVYALHVRAEAEGRGIGRALLAAAARRWRERGAQSFLLWCFAANPACGFYEALGGAVVAHGLDEDVPDLAFAWRDLPGLMARCGA